MIHVLKPLPKGLQQPDHSSVSCTNAMQMWLTDSIVVPHQLLAGHAIDLRQEMIEAHAHINIKVSHVVVMLWPLALQAS